MQQFKSYGFRNQINKYIYIDNQEILPLLASYFEVPPEATGFLSYCSLDHVQGMNLEVLCSAYFNETSKSLKLYAPNETSISLPYEAMLDSQALLLPENILPLEKFSNKINSIIKHSEVNEEIAKTRNIVAMDHLRKIDNPDTVLVNLVYGDDQIEEHYVLIESVGEMNLSGILLTEPVYDYGVHQGDRMNFFLVRNEKGVMCLAIM